MQWWLLTKNCFTATFKPHYLKSIKQIRYLNHAMSSTDMVYIYNEQTRQLYIYHIPLYITQFWMVHGPSLSKIWPRMLRVATCRDVFAASTPATGAQCVFCPPCFCIENHSVYHMFIFKKSPVPASPSPWYYGHGHPKGSTIELQRLGFHISDEIWVMRYVESNKSTNLPLKFHLSHKMS